MFIFKPTEKTYSDPASAIFVPGIPFGREYSKGDICFLHEEFGSKLYFNSKILRQAILNSKDYLEEVLELKITDAHKEPVKVEPKVEDVKKEEKPVEPEETKDETIEDLLLFEEESLPKTKTTKKK